MFRDRAVVIIPYPTCKTCSKFSFFFRVLNRCKSLYLAYCSCLSRFCLHLGRIFVLSLARPIDSAKRDSAKRDSAKRDSAKRDSAKRDSAKRDSAKREDTIGEVASSWLITGEWHVRPGMPKYITTIEHMTRESGIWIPGWIHNNNETYDPGCPDT